MTDLPWVGSGRLDLDSALYTTAEFITADPAAVQETELSPSVFHARSDNDYHDSRREACDWRSQRLAIS